MTFNHPDVLLLVFTKAPVPGQVKTRLIPPLDTADAANLHSQLVRYTLTKFSGDLCPVQLWCAPDKTHEFFIDCSRQYHLTLHNQLGDNLGERMSYALKKALATYKYAILIGTDCPSLSHNDVEVTISNLKKGFDVVLGPARDGGYVLIGVSRFDDRIFENIEWGSNRVLRLTRVHLSRLKWQTKELHEFSDIDRPEDLHLAEEAGINMADLNV